MKRYLPFAIIGLVLLITAGGGLLLFRSKYSSTPLKIATGTPGAEPAHIRGSAKARITLEEFGDFQCPPCGILATTLQQVEHDYQTSVRVIFREFPLVGMHAHAMTAACAAEAAGLQGHFWEMHDLLFQNAVQWSKKQTPPVLHLGPTASPSTPEDAATTVRATFIGYAEKIGLDVERFKKDMDSEQVKARIQTDQDRGASMGIIGTPNLYIDGFRIPFTSFNVEGLHDRFRARGKNPLSRTSIPNAGPAVTKRKRSANDKRGYLIAISFGSNSAAGYFGFILSSAATTVSSMTRLRIHLRSAGTIHHGACPVAQLLITSS